MAAPGRHLSRHWSTQALLTTVGAEDIFSGHLRADSAIMSATPTGSTFELAAIRRLQARVSSGGSHLRSAKNSTSVSLAVCCFTTISVK
jgi:hypothetical protein